MANSFLASVEYPDSDGEPMVDNTLQWDTIAYLVTAVRRWYADRADVFVADAVGHRSEILGLTLAFREDFFDLRTSSASLLRPDELGASVDQLTGEVARVRRESAAAQRAAAAARDEADAARQEAELLRVKLRAAGIDPRA